MSEPSMDWKETIEPDEEIRHAAFVAEIVALQERLNRKYGPGRAFHRKQIAGVTGSFTVAAELPEHAAQGVFAEARSYPAVIRMSNGAVTEQPDITPDVRGLAVSLRDVSGPGALGQPTDRQDLLFLNRSGFGFDNSADFAGLVAASAQGQTEIAKYLIRRYGTVRGSLELARIGKDLFVPFPGFANGTFHTASTIRFGPYAARLRLRPRERLTLNPLALQDLHRDIGDRLRRNDVNYEIQAQFFVSEKATPIENSRDAWPESRAPFATLGVLTVPVQDIDCDQGKAVAASVEADHFDPWSALEEHRPLGEVMRARKAAYYPSVQGRRATD